MLKNYLNFYINFLKSYCLFKMLFEMINMFSQFGENFLTNLLRSIEFYQGAKMFLILIPQNEESD